MNHLRNMPVVEIALRGLVYALAIATLVVFWPAEAPVFIYQGF